MGGAVERGLQPIPESKEQLRASWRGLGLESSHCDPWLGDGKLASLLESSHCDCEPFEAFVGEQPRPAGHSGMAAMQLVSKAKAKRALQQKSSTPKVVPGAATAMASHHFYKKLTLLSSIWRLFCFGYDGKNIEGNGDKMMK